MRIDTYTKVLLTGIFLFLGVIAFDLKPDIEAQASSSGVPQKLASETSDGGVWWLWHDRLKHCLISREGNVQCTPYVKWRN